MSNAVDNRVVQLEMDNGSFEKNAGKSIKTLNKLDEALNFKNWRRSFDEVEAAAAKCDFKPLLSAADTVVAKFSAMQVAGLAALTNLTNKALDTGIRMAKSLSVDQITSGYSKYEQKTANVQTLINSTGKSINEVNGYLDRLMWFSDETSYGFTDMTQALATMVSAGGDIDKIVPMIEGMANATAFAGKGASEFNRVIYNLNQSYSQGFLSYMDWKSIQMAGANSKQLVETLIQAGEEAGTIKKGEVTIDNFTDTLSKKWATREVMEKGFGYFDEMTQKAYEMIGTLDDQGNKIETASQAYDILSRKYDGVSINAAKAAQEAKSFTEAVDSTKDAVSSGWMRTFEIIFGNYEQAKVLWTDVANGLWDIFAGGFEDRNNMFQEVFQSSPVKEYAQSLEDAGVKFDEFKSKLKQTYRENGKGMSDKEFEALTAGATTFEELLSQSWVKSSLLEKTIAKLPKDLTKTVTSAKKASGNVSDLLKDLNSGKYGYGIEEQQKKLAEAGIDGSDALGGNWVQKLYNTVASGNEEAIDGLNKTLFATEEVTDSVEEQTTVWDNLAKKAKEFDNDGYYAQNTGRTIMLDGLKNILNAVGDRLDVIKKAWEKAFPAMTAERLRNMIIAFHSFTNTLKMSSEEGERLGAIFDKVFGILSKIKTVIDSFGKLSLSIAKLAGRFATWVVNLEPVKSALEVVKEFLGQSYDGATKGLDSFIKKIESLKETIDGIGEKDFEKLFASIKNFSSKIEGASKQIKKYSETIKTAILSVFSNIGSGFANGKGTRILAGGAFVGAFVAILAKIKSAFDKSGIKGIVDKITGIVDKITGILDSIGSAFNSFTKKMNSGTLRNIAVSIGILAVSLLVLSSIDGDKLASGLVGIAGAATVLYFVVKKLASLTTLLGGLDDAKSFASIGKVVRSISASLLMLSVSVKLLSTMNLDQALIALGSLYMMTIIMQKMAKSMVGVDTKGMGSLIGIAASLVIFAVAVKILSKLSVGGAIKGLASIGILMIELQWFLNKISDVKAGNMIAMAFSLVAIAGAFVILSAAMSILGLLSVGSLIKGLASIGAILVMFGLFANKIDSIDIGSLLAATASIVLISGALVLIAGALAVFSLVQDKSGSVIGMATALVAIALALGLLSNFGGGAGNLLAAAASILVISVALGALAVALATFGAIGNSLGALLTMLGALVIVIGGLGLAATFMAPIIPLMAALGGILLMVSAAVFLAGAGLVLLATGIAAFSASILANIGTVIAALLSLVGGLGSVLFALGSVIISVIGQLIPSLVDAGLQLINALISGFSSNVGGIVEGVAQLLVNLVTALMSSLGMLIQAGIKLAIALVNGIADGIRNNSEAIFDALFNILSSIIELLIGAVGKLLGKIPGIGPKIEEALNGAEEAVRGFLTGDKGVDVPVDVTFDPDTTDDAASKGEEAGTEYAKSAKSAAINEMLGFNLFGDKGLFTDGKYDTSKVSPELQQKVNETMAQYGIDPATLEGQGEQDVMAYFQGAHNGIENAASDGESVGQAVADDISNSVCDSIESKSTDVGASMTTMLSNAANSVDVSGVSNILSNKFITKFGESLINSLNGGEGATGASGEGTATGIDDALTQFLTSLVNDAGFGASGAAGANEFAGEFSNTVESGENQGKAKSAGTVLANSGNSGLSSVSTFASGANFGQGFANGILSKVQTVAAAAAELANAATSSLNTGIDAHSPSRVAMKSGSYFTEGFIIGIDMRTMYAAAAAYKMGSDSIDALNAGIQNGEITRVMPVLDTSDLYNQMDEFDGIYRPVIKPTLDMSNVDPAYRNMTAVATARYSGYDGESGPQGASVSGGSVVNYTQNNYSPKALSSVEIYRQTKNQLNSLEKRFAKK